MKIFLFCIIFPFLTGSASADIIFFNKADEANGKILSLDAGKVRIDVEGKTKEYDLEDVLKIQLVKEYRPGKGHPDPKKDKVLESLLGNPPKAKDYPNDGYLTWLMDVTIDIKNDKSYSVTRRGVRYVLRERGKSPAGHVKFNYLPDLQNGVIEYARTILGEKVSYLNDISVQKGSEYSFYPLYDRLKSTKFSVPDVKIGSIIDYKYRVETPVHYSTYPFHETVAFRHFEPARVYRLTVTAPAGLELKYEESNMPQSRLFTKRIKGARAVYTWEMRDVGSFRREALTPPFMRYAPQVTVSLANDWGKIQNDFAALLKKRIVITEEIKSKMKKLLPQRMNDLRKVETLYNWVVREIQYQPVGMNSYSFIPNSTDKIFRLKTGNLLDKPFLLYAMLREAGFTPYFVYVTTKDDPPFKRDMPNIRQFDAAQVALKLNNKSLILCPVKDNYRYNQLPGWLQGVGGLKILGGAGESPIFSNPLLSPDMESSLETNTLKLDRNGNLKGNFVLQPLGNHQVGWRGFKDSKKEEIDKFFEQFIHDLHPNARLDSYKIENLDDLSKDIVVTASYNITGYALKAGGRYLLFKLPGIEQSAWAVGQTERKLPMFWYHRNKTLNRATVSLPKGFKLYYAPEEITLEAAGQKYHAAYKAEGGSLNFTEESVRVKPEIPIENYPEYKNYKETLAKFSENWIVLEKK